MHIVQAGSNKSIFAIVLLSIYSLPNKRYNMEPNSLSNQNTVNRLINFIEAGGPEESQYDELTQIWNCLYFEEHNISNFLTEDRLTKLFGYDFFNQTIQGFGYRKLHGYSGDFEIIDMAKNITFTVKGI